MSVIQQNQSVSEMEVEQQRVMREWTINQLDAEDLPYFEGVNNIQNKREVLYVNLHRIGLKGTIIIVKNDEYTPWYSLNKLASLIGYSESKSMFKEKGLLYGYEHKLLKNLLGEFTPEEIIDPEDIQANKHTSNMNSIYIPHKVASILMILAGQQEKFRAQSKILTNLMDKIDTVTNKVITKLNRIIAEYRHQEQARELQKFKDDKEFIEKEKERLRVERIQTALIQYPDCNLQKTHKVYIFSCPQYLEQLVPMVKIGITDNLQVRLKQHQTSCPEGRFYFEIDTYDSKGSEQALLNMYRNYGLLLRFNNSAAEEWIKISSLERTKERLTLVAEHRNGEYEDLSDECRLIRELFVGEPEPFLVNGQKFIPYKPDGTTIMVPPNKKFIEKICEKIGINDNKTIVNKTTLLNTIRDVKKQDEFKTTKSKLPIDIDTFLEQKIDGISIKKELKGRSIQITIEITQE